MRELTEPLLATLGILAKRLRATDGQGEPEPVARPRAERDTQITNMTDPGLE
jgi:hypothetical protein